MKGKINLQFIANPYISFSLIWSFGLMVYLLGWSDKFPVLSIGLITFLTGAIILSFFLGRWLFKNHYFSFKYLNTYLNDKVLMSVNIFFWIINFIYSKIPLFEILRGVEFGYTDFGVPYVIVFTTCYNSFLCVYYFNCYLSEHNKKFLFYYLVCISFYVLAYSRGLIMITFLSTIFLSLAANGNKIKLKQVVVFLLGMGLVLYAFGYAGNIRTAQAVARDNNKSNYDYDNTIILKIASASSSFSNNIIPNEFFWTYVYIASPISNLQLNVSKEHYTDYTFTDFASLVINEMFYETISKRLGDTFPEIKRKDPDLVINNLNVATVFTRSYMNMGYLGLCLMFFYMSTFPIIYIKIIGFKSQYLSIALSIMCSIYFFSIFDNMFEFVGAGPQLLFPLFFEFRDRLKKSNNGKL